MKLESGRPLIKEQSTDPCIITSVRFFYLVSFVNASKMAIARMVMMMMMMMMRMMMRMMRMIMTMIRMMMMMIIMMMRR